MTNLKIPSNPQFSESQNKALVSLNKNTIVSAGAGSGKTTVLSAKVKALVEHIKIPVNKMLILTFTNLAAQEMKDRIKKNLMKYDFNEALKVDTADISTFDSFALSIVKKYHFLLGIDENVSIISDVVMKANRNKWVDELLISLYDERNAKFISLGKRLIYKSDDDLRNLLIKTIEKVELFDDKNKYFSNKSLEEANIEFEELFVSFYAELEKIRSEAYDALSNIDNEKYKEKCYDDNDDFFNAKDYDQLIKGIKTFSLPKGRYTIDAANKEVFIKVKDKIITDKNKKLQDKKTLKDEYISALEYKNYIKSLAKIIYDKENEFKDKHQCFTFSDIADFAYKIVSEHEDIRLSLKEKYDIIMVDEYQDTSYSQEKFLKLIENNNMFMVGDIKQSIYRFRNARPDIFQNKYDLFSLGEEGIKIDLNDNFRSRKEVLNDINTIFKNLMTNNFGGADYARDHVINPGNKLYNTTSTNPNKTEALVYNYNKDIKEEKAEIEANIIADDILKKLESNYQITEFYEEDINGVKTRKARSKKATYSSFCIIQSNTTDFPTYVEVFEKKGIPLFVQSNEEVSANHLIRIAINALSLIEKIIDNDCENAEFNHYIISLSRCYIFNESDKNIYDFVKQNNYKETEVYKTFENIVLKSTSNSIVEKMELFFEETDAFYKLLRLGNYERNSAYYESFISYFEEMDRLNLSIKDAIELLKCIDKYKIKLTLPALETSVDAVKLINAHKSKGLEYNFVYFSNLYKHINLTDTNKSYNVSIKYDISFNFRNGLPTLDHYLFQKEELSDALSEYLRLFYVELTRAKEQMIFVYPLEEKEDAPIKEKHKCRSFYDFLKTSRFSVFEELIEEPLKEKEKREVKYLENLNEKVIEIENINLDYIKKEKVNKSSSTLSLDSSISNLKLGNDIHFLLRAIDFYKKDLSMLKEKEKTIIERFFNSTLFKKIENGKFYKEYEFDNDVNKGIIDLFAVLDNEVIIVDYKLKNLEKEEYNKQLNIYAKHLAKVFKKPVKAYLYALFTGEFQEVALDL